KSTTTKMRINSPPPSLPNIETSFGDHCSPPVSLATPCSDVAAHRLVPSQRPSGLTSVAKRRRRSLSAEGHRVHELLESLPGHESDPRVPALEVVDRKGRELLRDQHAPVGVRLLEGDDELADGGVFDLRVVA